MTAVSWRRVLVALVTVAIGLGGTIVALRADGFAAVDATVPRATRWFVHQATEKLILADGFSGRTLARLDPTDTDDGAGSYEIVQNASGVALLDRERGTVRSVDSAALRLGPATPVRLVAEPGAIVGIGQSGLIAVEPGDDEGVLIPPDGESVTFDVAAIGSGQNTRISPSGSVWTLVDGTFSRITTIENQVVADDLSGARFTLVGTQPLLLDVAGGRVLFGTDDWVDLPDRVPPTEVTLQEPGPLAECGWIGFGDDLWCIGSGGIVHRSTIDGLGLTSLDRFAIAGDAGAVIRAQSSQLRRLDWRAGELIDEVGGDEVIPRVPDAAQVAISSSVDLIWVDDQNGDRVWSVHPWGVEVIDKADPSAPLLGETGEVVEGGSGAPADEVGSDDVDNAAEREPDNDGVEDPPVAVDDSVSARFGVGVSVVVTANDYDPDGGPIAVQEVGAANRGEVSISNASTVLYSPEQGFVGVDTFEYTIVDDTGLTASATVTVQLLPADAPNRAPVGRPDQAATRAGRPVVIDVLANDVDPERDLLQIGSFTEPSLRGGTLTQEPGPTELQALVYTPPRNSTGTATFTYRPVDSFGALGEPVPVTVEIVDARTENLPPVARPDAVRLRRGEPTAVSVVLNDRDDDGDILTISPGDVPPGLLVETTAGNQLTVTALAGAPDRVTFTYLLDDQVNDPVVGTVLVIVIDAAQRNQAPVASADTDSVVVGRPKLIPVLANDTDPDGDPIFLVSAGPADPDKSIGTVQVQGNRLLYVANELDSEEAVFERLVYRISDGELEGVGEVTVRVLPEPIAAPPFARDDSVTTEVDEPVTIDVLRNDGDPSGGQLSIITASCATDGADADPTESNQVRVTPPPGFDGVFTCSYEVVNEQGLSDGAQIVVSVVRPPNRNRPPVVPPRIEQMDPGETRTVRLLDNVTDPDPGAVLQVLSVNRPPVGVATPNLDVGTLTYVAPSTPGNYAATFQVSDGQGAEVTGRITFEVLEPDPIAPTALDDVRTVPWPASSPVAIRVTDNDLDDEPSAQLQVTSTRVTGSVAQGVSVAPDGGRILISLPPEFEGTVTGTYVVTDADGLTATAAFTLTVADRPNRAPVLGDDQATVGNGGRVSVLIAENDSDPDGDPLTYELTTLPNAALGSAALQGTTLTFDAVPGAEGDAIVRYSATDGELEATATVRIAVLPCTASSPSAASVSLNTGYLTPIEIDFGALASNGEIISVDPAIDVPVGVYSPPVDYNGVQTFTYVVRNSCGLRASGTVSVDVNLAPVPADPISRTMGRNGTDQITIGQLATDPDQQGLTIVELPGAPAWITIGADGQRIDIAPSGASGTASFSAVVVDPGGLPATVPITITLTNQPPVAVDDEVRADNGPVVITPLANDSDPEGDEIRLQQVPSQATFTNGVSVPLEVIGDREIRLDPGAGTGTATFAYTIVDVFGVVSAPATITVRVNSPPVAPNVDVSLPAGGSVTVTVPVSDPDGGTLTLTMIDDSSPLTITFNGSSVTITAPLAPENVFYLFRYRVTDERGASDTGVLNINVGAAPTTTTTTTTTTVPPTTTTTTTTTTLAPGPPNPPGPPDVTRPPDR